MDISKVVEIKMKDISLQGLNVRSDLDSPNSKEALLELAENIKVNGLMQPIVLKGSESDKPPYDVIVGQRRFKAHELLGAKTIKATFSGDIDNMQALLMSLSENMCRQDMNFEDSSNAITKLFNYYGKDEYKVQKHTGFSIRMIRSYVKIDEQATEKIKNLLKENKISVADAKRTIDAAQGDHEKADILIDEIVKLTKYEKKRLIESANKNPKAKASELIAEAKKPKFEETIILNLTSEVSGALRKATKKLLLDAEELTMNALVHWLKTNDFLVEQS